ncbi:MAG: hypothetical protein JWR67_2217 [Mucilaginibacter sp.]|nr:hypothetical protein [Mucilaginibacter sp.]
MDNTATEKQTLRILFLASEPSNMAKLHLGRELQEVRNRLSANAYFEIKDQQAVKPDDVLQTILNYKPHIVHFSGHGQDTGELCFEDERGNSKVIPPEALASLFSLVNDYVKCVIVNTCYSEVQATAIAQFVPVVIGTKKEITDSAAIKFSTGFYTSLDPDLTQNSLKTAFKRGCIAIQFDGKLEDHLLPVLIEGSPEVRFSSEVDTAFLPISTPKGLVVQTLIRGLTLTGKKMGLTDAVVEMILEEKVNKLTLHNQSVAEYEKYLNDILRDEFPLSDASTSALLQLQNGLGLSNEDILLIKDKVFKKLPDTAEKWFDRGRGQSDLGNFDKAIEYYTKAIEKDQDYSAAYYDRGYCHVQLQDYEVAITDYTKAIEFNNKWEMLTNLSLAYYSRGHAYLSISSDDEDKTHAFRTLALNDFDKSIELKPNDPNAYYNRGLIYEFFNEFDKATIEFKKSYELDESMETKTSTAVRLAKIYSTITFQTDEAKKWTDIALNFLNKKKNGAMVSDVKD